MPLIKILLSKYKYRNLISVCELACWWALCVWRTMNCESRSEKPPGIFHNEIYTPLRCSPFLHSAFAPAPSSLPLSCRIPPLPPLCALYSKKHEVPNVMFTLWIPLGVYFKLKKSCRPHFSWRRPSRPTPWYVCLHTFRQTGPTSRKSVWVKKKVFLS